MKKRRICNHYWSWSQIGAEPRTGHYKVHFSDANSCSIYQFVWVTGNYFQEWVLFVSAVQSVSQSVRWWGVFLQEAHCHQQGKPPEERLTLGVYKAVGSRGLNRLPTSMFLPCVASYYTPRFNEVERGVYWFHLVRLYNIPWIWRIIYGHKLPYIKKTRKKKQVCGAACFMAAEIKFSKDVRLSVCGQNRICSVSSTILIGSISYLHILSSNFRRCVACNVCFKI